MNETISKSYPGSWVTYGTYNIGAGSVNYRTPSTRVAATLSITRTGSNTPGYGTPAQPRPLPVTNFSYRKAYIVNEFGSSSDIDYVLNPSQYGYNTVFNEGTKGVSSNTGRTASQSELDAVTRRANAKLLVKLKNQKVNLGNALGERKQIIGMVASTATRIAECISALKKGNFARAAEHLGVASRARGLSRFNAARRRNIETSVASGWLELQYGWKPLLSDIYGACEHAANSANNVIINKASASAKQTIDLSSTVKVTSNGVTTWTTTKGQIDITARYGVTYTTSIPAFRTAAQLGLLNPYSVAWELLPYSFVIDWFIPIGEYINSWDADFGLHFQDGYFVIGQNCQFNRVESKLGKSYGQYNTARWESSSERIWIDRTKLASFPTPMFPQFKSPFSVGHAANALALLTQAFKKRA